MRQTKELSEEIRKEKNRGSTLFEKVKRINFCFLYGCRPSTGVKANTTMVKDIYGAFIENADRINLMVLLPQTLDFIKGNDASFETAVSSQI